MKLTVKIDVWHDPMVMNYVNEVLPLQKYFSTSVVRLVIELYSTTACHPIGW